MPRLGIRGKICVVGSADTDKNINAKSQRRQERREFYFDRAIIKLLLTQQSCKTEREGFLGIFFL